MEVATILSSSEETHHLFDRFIYSFALLHFNTKDIDTAYFRSVLDERDKVFYHYELNDPEREFSYNYRQEEIAQIKQFYGQREIFMFDLSYRPEELLTDLLKAFKAYIGIHNVSLLSDISISHPFDGFKCLDIDY